MNPHIPNWAEILNYLESNGISLIDNGIPNIFAVLTLAGIGFVIVAIITKIAQKKS